MEALLHYSNGDINCACCGERELEFLCLDHIKNDGYKFRRKIKDYSATSQTAKIKGKWIKGLQVLCHNCNMAKQFYGGCPHKKLKT